MKIFNKFIWSKKEPSNKNDIWFDGSTWRMYTEEAWQSFTLPVDAADKVAKVLENASEVYQEKLNAGYGIVIEGNTISLDVSSIDINTTYNIGSIQIFDDTISSQNTYYLTTEDIEAIKGGKLITTTYGDMTIPAFGVSGGGSIIHIYFYVESKLYDIGIVDDGVTPCIFPYFCKKVDILLYRDDFLSEISENSVQNKVITAELNKKLNKTDVATINGQSLTEGGNIVIPTGGESYDDTEIKQQITELSTGIVIKKGDGENSAVLKGGDNQAISEGSVALGKDNIVGLKGWYYSSIYKENDNTISVYLSNEQKAFNSDEDLKTESQTADELLPNLVEILGVNAVISLVNAGKYDDKFIVIGGSNGVVRLQTIDGSVLPFNIITGQSVINYEDYSIYCLSKPDAGIADLGKYSFAVGYNNKATNGESTAFGYNNHAYGKFSFVEGKDNKAGYASHAEGRSNIASGSISHAEGRNNVASGYLSHAEGGYNIAEGAESHAEGYYTIARGARSHAEGYDAKAIGESSHAEGENSQANGKRAHAEGYNTKASGNTSHAEGFSAKANGAISHAEGYSTEASGDYSHAEGYSTEATGSNSHAEGNDTEAEGTNSHAEGDSTKAIGESSHAEGSSDSIAATIKESDTKDGFAGLINKWINKKFSLAYGHSAHIEGRNNLALGVNSHAEGSNTTAKGINSHAEGTGTLAEGDYSHAEGDSTTAVGDRSHAEGNTTKAEGINSHAEGYKSQALGPHSHAEGNETKTEGSCAHAEGYKTQALGKYSHAEGNNTISKNEAEHACGKYNSSTQSNDSAQATRFSIGIGTPNTDRKNAVEVKANGDVYIIGVGGYDGINSDSAQTLQEILANL